MKTSKILVALSLAAMSSKLYRYNMSNNNNYSSPIYIPKKKKKKK